jgi:hypothetical protein
VAVVENLRLRKTANVRLNLLAGSMSRMLPMYV